MMSVDRLIRIRLTRRRFAAIALAVPAVAALPVGLRSAGAQDAVVCTMVTDTAGLGDQNFNDLAFKGGEKAAAEFGIEWKAIESPDVSAYVPNLTAAAEQGQLIIAVGFKLTDAVNEVAPQFADKNFLIIDSVVDQPNVRSALFAEQEIGFLVGVIAGKSTKTNKLGIVGGERIPPVIRYEVGFAAGVKSVNPAAEISIAYTNNFEDPAQGKELALAQYEQGADIVFPIAGRTGTGAYQAAADKGEGFWVIGADTSQDHLAPGRELCTAQKGVDFASYTACKDVAQGAFTVGLTTYDLKSGGISLQTIEGRVPAEVVGLAHAYQQMIIDGTLVPPVDDDTLAAFVPPAEPVPLMASPEAGT